MNKKILFLSTALLLSFSAKAGLPEALMNLNYEQYPAAFAEFQALAGQGNASALYYLGKMYQNGWGVPKDTVQAVNYFRAANGSFYLPAAAQLGKILLHGTSDGIAPDPKVAIDLLKQAALAGSSDAALELANAVLEGLMGEVNFNHAFGFYYIAALKGEKKAQYQLGQMYLSGRGITQDFRKAILWLSRSANQGYVKAQIALADLYENNQKLKNISRAYAWNSILAAYNSDSVGSTAAQKRDELAKKIQKKDLSERQEAIRSWSPKTAEESVPLEEKRQQPPTIPNFNDPKTLQQILLQEGALPQDSMLYGLSMDQIDIAEATGDRSPLTEAVEKALKQGQKTAAVFYGDLLRNRFHLPQEAVEWYQRGADLGDPYAQYQLAKASCEGWADPPNSSKCYAWLLIAKETPDPVLTGLVQQALLTVRTNATAEELEQGTALKEEIQKQVTHQEKEKKLLDFF